ncbi:MAG: TetR/AcrR family transcriptional regulator [Candidatus Limivicinus sp.]|jgi:AcrR family transcriptional regulator
MKNLTRTAIQKSFKKLLDEKNLNQISVRDIIDDCGVSRSTFYYHFSDIPELLESIVKEDADSIIDDYPKIESIADCVNAVIDTSLKNRKAVLHIYKSLNRYIFEKYHWKSCEYAVTRYLDTCIKDTQISEGNRRILINYMKSVCFGIVMCWLDNNLEDSMREDIKRICEIKQGDVQALIKKFQTDTARA